MKNELLKSRTLINLTFVWFIRAHYSNSQSFAFQEFENALNQTIQGQLSNSPYTVFGEG